VNNDNELTNSSNSNSESNSLDREDAFYILDHVFSHPSSSFTSHFVGSSSNSHALSGSSNRFGRRFRSDEMNIDNMSYEDLLQLEESIGSVNIGITKEEFDQFEKIVVKVLF
jgi:hypothetical protein